MERRGQLKSPYFLTSVAALLLGAANMFLAPAVMSFAEQWMRTHHVLPRFVNASPPFVSQDEHGNIVEHPLDIYYRVRWNFQIHFPSIVICFAGGVAIGSWLFARWFRFALLLSIVYCFTPYLFPPWKLLILFGGFDAATPLDIWLDQLQSVVIIASSSSAGAWIGSRHGNRRRNAMQLKQSVE